MKALVTGGAGFIGSHLVDLLLKKNYQVVALDNLVTGRKENLSKAFKNSSFVFIEEDVCDLSSETIDGSLDEIYHLASPASPADFQKLSLEIALTNSFGTLNTLNLAVSKKAKHLLASTSEVYGDPEKHPQKEDYFGNANPFGPRSCYDESKRFAETLVRIYLDKFGLDGRVVRIFNTYGPRMRADDGRAVSNFIVQALKDQPLTIYGKGRQTRSFCYIDDMVKGIFQAMKTKATKGEIFNLGSQDELSIVSLAEKIVEKVGQKKDFSYRHLPQDDPQQRQPDITKAMEILDWQPRVSLDDGLEKTIAHFRKTL